MAKGDVWDRDRFTRIKKEILEHSRLKKRVTKRVEKAYPYAMYDGLEASPREKIWLRNLPAKEESNGRILPSVAMKDKKRPKKGEWPRVGPEVRIGLRVSSKGRFWRKLVDSLSWVVGLLVRNGALE